MSITPIKSRRIPYYADLWRPTQTRRETRAPKQTPTCGPDVTGPLVKVLKAVSDAFDGWTYWQRVVACSPFYAALAWDIHELSSYGWPGTSEWMNQSDYAPPCCTPKRCHNTVEADGQCYYAGSVNYILLGVMARLCGKYNQAEIIFAVAFKKLLDGSSAELRETETDWGFRVITDGQTRAGPSYRATDRGAYRNAR